VGGDVLGNLGRGVVDDEFAARELGPVDGTGFDLVAGRAALERDERFELAAPVGRRREAQPAPRACSLHAGRKNDTAGMWWHASTTTRP
jgi:hypothetical protein